MKFPEIDPPHIEGRCRWCGDSTDDSYGVCHCYAQCGDPDELNLVFDLIKENPRHNSGARVLEVMTDPNGVARSEELLADLSYRPPFDTSLAKSLGIPFQAPDATGLPRYMGAAISALANVGDPRSAETMERAFQYLSDNPQLREVDRIGWIFTVAADIFRYWRGIGDTDRLAQVIESDSVWSWGAAVILAETGDERAFQQMNRAISLFVGERPEGWIDPTETAIELNAPELLESLKSAFLGLASDGQLSAMVPIEYFRMARYFVQLSDAGIDTLEQARSIRGHRIIYQPWEYESAVELESVEAFMLTYDVTASDDRTVGTRFGGQPTWRAEPTWPLDPDGDPMSFWCQIEYPWDPSKMAYLFMSTRPNDLGQSDDGTASLIIQPGPVQEVSYAAMTYGPLVRNTAEPLRPFASRTPSLRPFQDPIIDDDETDGPEASWDKVGGVERRLHDRSERGSGWKFLFEFSAESAVREIADGAQCYGWVHEDGRGWFDWDCH